jgi:hypothetical protein
LGVIVKRFCGIVWGLGICAFLALSGCVMRETYGQQELPESERALVEGYWHYRLLYDEELHIVSVDGKRESGQRGWRYALSVSLPSGKHWLQLAILRNSREIARCAFDWNFEAGVSYKVQHLNHEQFLLAHPRSPQFSASISMRVTAPGKPEQRMLVPAVCGQSVLCRQSSDCPSEHSCQTEAGFAFGTCN